MKNPPENPSGGEAGERCGSVPGLAKARKAPMRICIWAGTYHGQRGVWVAARPVAGEDWHRWRFDDRPTAIAHARQLARDFGGRISTAQVLPFPSAGAAQ